MKLIRKYARALSLLSALMALVAAPYLIPENPDSAVFRSGALGLILVLSCAYPVYQALNKADRRTLVCSLGFGLLLSSAMSLGSELFIYDGLLPGMGSMIRRLAVPVMAAPLLGGLAAGVMCAAPPQGNQRALPIPAYALALFICWLPLLLAYFPGMLNYDFEGQYSQHLVGNYSSLHPLLHSVLANGIITLGEMLHSRTFGVLLMSLIQMALLALALGYSCRFAAKRGAPAWAVLLLLALYALHPVFPVMALSMTKDTLFAAAVLVLSLLTWEMLESGAPFGLGRRLLFIVCVVGTALLRNNGAFALALLMPGLIACARGMRKRAAALCAAGLAATLLTSGLLTAIYQPETMPSFQLYSLPAQQLVRAYNVGEMTEAEKEELRGWYTDAQWGLKLNPHLADAAKGYIDRPRIAEEGDAFLDLWARVGKNNARVYAEALLMLNVGSWYPDDLSHSTIYPDASWNDKGYLQTQEYDMTAQGIFTASYLPKLRNLMERICRRNCLQEYPVISVLLCTATPLWVILLAGATLIAKRRAKMLPALLGVLGLWLSYLLGPCTLPRYTLPLFCLAPVMLIVALYSPARLKEEPQA